MSNMTALDPGVNRREKRLPKYILRNHKLYLQNERLFKNS